MLKYLRTDHQISDATASIPKPKIMEKKTVSSLDVLTSDIRMVKAINKNTYIEIPKISRIFSTPFILR